jgi:hypothetical protein
MCQLLGVIFLDKSIVNLKQLTTRRAFLDVAFVLRQHLAALDHEHTISRVPLAATASYISQLLTRKKAPPAPLLQDVRVLMFRTCQPDKAPECIFHGWEGDPGVRCLFV